MVQTNIIKIIYFIKNSKELQNENNLLMPYCITTFSK